MAGANMPKVARFIADVLQKKRAPQSVAPEVAACRAQFSKLHFIRG